MSSGIGIVVLVGIAILALRNWKATLKFIVPYLVIAWIGVEFAKAGEKWLGILVVVILLFLHHKWVFKE